VFAAQRHYELGDGADVATDQDVSLHILKVGVLSLLKASCIRTLRPHALEP
jgi:hypothetical protein